MNYLRRATLFALVALTCTAVVAQPPRRRTSNQNTAKTNTPVKGSAYRDFPTAQPMPADAAWRRDIYRTLDLTKDANAVLYYPTMPQGNRMNLFTFLFHAIHRGQIKAYDYKLDGNEDFSAKNEVKVKDLMDRYEIFYETNAEGKTRVNDADLPSDQVKVYLIKESEYYDQYTATFRKKVTAICPFFKLGYDFCCAYSQYPMFWVKYDDIAPYLGQLMLMGSNVNNAATMSADDFFTLGAYQGDIYKTTNLQDRILVNEIETDADVTHREQQRIEREIIDFQDHMWGRDSVAMAKKAAEQALADSLAAVEKPKSKRTTTSRTPSRRSTTTVKENKTTKTKTPKTKTTRSSTPKATRNSGSGGTISVRRQRH